MSANNWTTCPACQAKHSSMVDAVKALYGQISAEEYHERMTHVVTEDKRPRKETLREDWEIGIYKGKFTVDYGASCSVCGWSKYFKHEEIVP